MYLIETKNLHTLLIMKFFHVIFLQLLLIAFTGKSITDLIWETNFLGLEKKMIENDESSDNNDNIEKKDKVDDLAVLNELHVGKKISIVEFHQIKPQIHNSILNRPSEIYTPPPEIHNNGLFLPFNI